MTRDRKGQAFVPGFLGAAARTPIMTAGELPGGGALFASCARAVEAAQLPLLPCDCDGGCSRAHAAICPRCGVIQRTDKHAGGE